MSSSRGRVSRRFRGAAAAALAIALIPGAGLRADSTPQALPFAQDWSNATLITVADNWSGVPGIVGFRGDDLTTATGTNPQTILADGTGTPVNVIANATNPNGLATGGVAEFDALPNPTIALNGSGTADAPFILVSISTLGRSAVTVSYNVRDLDGSADNAVQPVALHYRVGSSGSFTNLPAGFVADATSGPSLATLVTPVSVTSDATKPSSASQECSTPSASGRSARATRSTASASTTSPNSQRLQSMRCEPWPASQPPPSARLHNHV